MSGETTGGFSVYQYFPDGTYEEALRFVTAEEAVATALALATSIGARLGTTRRVMITDGDDFITWDWRHAEGIVFPEDDNKGRLKSGISEGGS